MNNFFISSIFSTFTLIIFCKIIAFSLYEIRNENNFSGGVCTIVLTAISVVFSNVMFWIS